MNGCFMPFCGLEKQDDSSETDQPVGLADVHREVVDMLRNEYGVPKVGGRTFLVCHQQSDADFFGNVPIEHHVGLWLLFCPHRR